MKRWVCKDLISRTELFFGRLKLIGWVSI